jgi:hypothetical protein
MQQDNVIIYGRLNKKNINFTFLLSASTGVPKFARQLNSKECSDKFVLKKSVVFSLFSEGRWSFWLTDPLGIYI